MEKLDNYSERLTHVQEKISIQLSRITRLQELVRREEEKLYAYLQQEKALKIALLI